MIWSGSLACGQIESRELAVDDVARCGLVCRLSAATSDRSGRLAGDARAQCRPGGRRAVEVELAADRLDTVVQAAEARSVCLVGAADPVVGDRDDEVGPGALHADA